MTLKSLGLLNYMANALLLVAICLGLYTRWLHSDDIAVLLIAFLGMFVFSLAVALVYYFSLESVGVSLLRLWIGCLLGVIAFTEPVMFDDTVARTIQSVTNWTLTLSICLHCLWIVLSYVAYLTTLEFRLASGMDCLEMVGFVIASLVVGQDFVSMMLLIAGLFFATTAIRLKSCLGLLIIVVFVPIVSVGFFSRLLNLSLNSYAVACFVGRIAFKSIVDWYFIGLTSLQRWNRFLVFRGVVRRLATFGIFVAELSFIVVHSTRIPGHKEWYIVVPIYALLAVVWFGIHAVLLVICWTFSNKITECLNDLRELPDENQNLQRIMASRGMRCFSIISHRIAIVSFITTNLIGIVAWTTKNALSVGTWFLVLPLEILCLSLFYNVGAMVSGTCVGFVIVTPAVLSRSDKHVTLIPTSFVQDLNRRSTEILTSIQNFFSFHLIEPFGFDYSSSGISIETIEAKIKRFYEKVTSDGPRFDTYLLYYSGPVYDNGDWALTGGERVTLTQLLDWWKSSNSDDNSRLIFVFDTEHSHRWVREVASIQRINVAIQTWRLSKSFDSELGSNANIGVFTQDWVNYNCAESMQIDWRSHDRVVMATYGVSRSWTDFVFRSPTSSDVSRYWDANIPRASRLLMQLASVPSACRFCICSDCMMRCLRRKRMKWLPPIEYDTEQGFKLVRSMAK